MRLSFALALGAWALASAAGAQVYRWVDPDGSVHYSDSPSSAPKDAKVEKTTVDDITVEGSGRIEAGTPPENKPVPEAAAPAATPAPAPARDLTQDSDTPDEQTVRQSFHDTYQKISDTERELAAQRKLADQANAGINVACPPEIQVGCADWKARRLQAREDAKRKVTALESDLRHWKGYLDDLERWASNHAVPRAWRQP
jgi:hypothetical protein